jgi:hypothetical protein
MARNKPTTKKPPFHIDAIVDGDGYTYSVSPWSEEWLLAKFPQAKPKRTQRGDWLLLEIGAGEVSALPPRLSPRTFYHALAQRI